MKLLLIKTKYVDYSKFEASEHFYQQLKYKKNLYPVTLSCPTASFVTVSGVTNAFLLLSVTISSMRRITATPSPHECSKLIPANPFAVNIKL